MSKQFLLVIILLFSTSISAQTDLQKMFDTEAAFINALAKKGMKSAFLEYLSDDATVFRPNSVNGKDYWKSQKDSDPALLTRTPFYADISANGQMGYTMGTWQLHPDGKKESPGESGQYLTIWEKRPGDKFFASIDIGIENGNPPLYQFSKLTSPNMPGDLNLRGWSVADASMRFFTASMEDKALGNAYKKFAAEDVRLLREQKPPIIGKDNVVKETRQYSSVGFPAKVALLQSADLAYIWNQCEFADSNEGRENGNCVHVWKFRNKKWYIVAGVFARVPNVIPPKLTTKPKPRVNPNNKKKKSEKD